MEEKDVGPQNEETKELDKNRKLKYIKKENTKAIFERERQNLSPKRLCLSQIVMYLKSKD